MDYRLMAIGYAATVVIETAVLMFALSRWHPRSLRLFAGIWLSACTYPIVWLVLPGFFDNRWHYLIVAETFAPLAECLLFYFAFNKPERRVTKRDYIAIVAANLLSFGIGELLLWRVAEMMR